MKILTLDLGKFNTMCCLFDTKTRKAEFLTAATDKHYLSSIFKKRRVDLVVMEACGPSGWINDLAISHGLKTLLDYRMNKMKNTIRAWFVNHGISIDKGDKARPIIEFHLRALLTFAVAVQR